MSDETGHERLADVDPGGGGWRGPGGGHGGAGREVEGLPRFRQATRSAFWSRIDG